MAAAAAEERRLLRIGAWTVVLSFGATVAALILWDGWVGWDPSLVFGGILAAALLPSLVPTWWLRRGHRRRGAMAAEPKRAYGLTFGMMVGLQVVFWSVRDVWPLESEVYDGDQFIGTIPRPDNAARSAIAVIVAGMVIFGLILIRRPQLFASVRPSLRRALIVAAHAPLIVGVLWLAVTAHAVEPNVEFEPSTGLPWSAWILVAAGWSIAAVLWTIGLPAALRLVNLLAAAILVGHLAGFFKEVPIGLAAAPIPVGDVAISLGLLLAASAAATISLVVAPPSPGEDHLADPGSWLLELMAAVRAELHRNDSVPWKIDPEPRPPDQGLAVGIHDRMRSDD